MRKLLFLICVIFSLYSCDTRRNMIDDNGVWVRVNTDWSRTGIEPNGTTVCFYPNRPDLSPIYLVTNETYDSVKLNRDNYSVLVFNETVNGHDNIHFRDMHSYKASEAYSKSITVPERHTKGPEENIVASPGMLGVSKLINLEMTRQMIENDERPTLNFTPEKRVTVVNVKIHIKGLLYAHVRDNKAKLSGLAGEINLSEESENYTPVTHYFDINKMKLDAGGIDGTISATFNTFGLAETPEGDEKVKSILTLYVMLRDGNPHTPIERDVTDLIKVVGEDEISLEIEIGLGILDDPIIVLPEVEDNPDMDSGFDADVDGWGPPIVTDIPV